MLVWFVFLYIFPTHCPAPPLQRFHHTLEPAHDRPLSALLHELHSRLYLRTGRELSFSQIAAGFFYN